MGIAAPALAGYGCPMSSTVDHLQNARALLGLFSVMARRWSGTTQVAISTATGLGVTRLQRLAGTWRPSLKCPPIDVAEAHALAEYAAGVLGVDQRLVALWLCGLADKKQAAQVEAAIKRRARQAVEKPARTINDVALPDSLADLLRK